MDVSGKRLTAGRETSTRGCASHLSGDKSGGGRLVVQMCPDALEAVAGLLSSKVENAGVAVQGQRRVSVTRVSMSPASRAVSGRRKSKPHRAGQEPTIPMSTVLKICNIAADRFDINAYRGCSQRKPKTGGGTVGVFGMETKLSA